MRGEEMQCEMNQLCWISHWWTIFWQPIEKENVPDVAAQNQPACTKHVPTKQKAKVSHVIQQ